MIHTNSVLVGDFSFEVCIISYHIILNVDSVYAYNNIPTMCHSDLTQVLSAAGGLLLLAAKMKPKDFALLTGCTLGCPAARLPLSEPRFLGKVQEPLGPFAGPFAKHRGLGQSTALGGGSLGTCVGCAMLCQRCAMLCHAVRWPEQVRLISCWFDAAGLAALGKG